MEMLNVKIKYKLRVFLSCSTFFYTEGCESAEGAS
jgi:hypothetical protein